MPNPSAVAYSSTSDLAMGMVEGAKAPKGKNLQHLLASQKESWNKIDKASMEAVRVSSRKVSEEPMLTLRCNYARNRAVDFGPFSVLFDKEGIAKVAEWQKQHIDKVRRVRQNRYFWVDEPKKPAPIVVPEPPKKEPTLVEELEKRVEEAKEEVKDFKSEEGPKTKDLTPPMKRKTTKKRSRARKAEAAPKESQE